MPCPFSISIKDTHAYSDPIKLHQIQILQLALPGAECWRHLHALFATGTLHLFTGRHTSRGGHALRSKIL